MSFVNETFLAALLMIGVPALLHLLHRRRFRTVAWAAMDFLLEATHRQRRWLEFRDLLLMLLRTAVVLLFILAMARPFWVSGPGSNQPTGAVHLVLVVDNSQSMALRPFDENLLETAKAKAADLIDRLPAGSVVSLLPTCAPDDFHLRDAYRSADDALDGLADIQLVDRAAWAGTTAERVRSALDSVVDVPTKRVVLVGDRQGDFWSGGDLSPYFTGIEEVQVASIGPEQPANSWVESFRLRDGFAGSDSPAVLLAQVRHEGPEPREDVRVTLRVGERIAEQRYIDLQPGQNTELVFEHWFEAVGTPDEPVFIPVTLELTPDRLAEDDTRWMIVPVVSSAPVVCIDTLGSAEDPTRNYYGESYPVRRLLTPRHQEADASLSPAIEVRHFTPSQVTRASIADARLVLLAGTASPSPDLVALLRGYAEQGGAVVVAAGGWFDPESWQRSAWVDGGGLLPMPLMDEPVGTVPTTRDEQLETFRIDPDAMAGRIIDLGLPRPVLRQLLLGPYFFKAVEVDESDTDALIEAITQRITQRRAWIEQNRADEQRWAELESEGRLTVGQRSRRETDRARRAAMTGRWLRWVNPLSVDPDLIPVEQLVERYLPRVEARFDNGLPFIVSRHVGRGQLVFISTGLLPRWNSLAADHAVILVDQMIRELVTQTIPSRNLGPVNEVVIPLDASMAGRSFALITPDGERRGLVPEAIDLSRQVLVMRDVHQRGVYRLMDVTDGEPAPDDPPMLMLAVNGPGNEGDLTRAPDGQVTDAVGEQTVVAFTPADEPLTLAGKTYVGTSLWRWLMALVLLLLLVELLMLALPHARRMREARSAGAEGVPA